MSFVRNIVTENDSQMLCSGIIALAHSLDLTTVAEGVETKEQMLLLDHMGCDYVQGYYFSRPVPAAEFERLLQQGFDY